MVERGWQTEREDDKREGRKEGGWGRIREG